jgi:hypothetical protein
VVEVRLHVRRSRRRTHHRRAIKALAEQARVPIDDVARLYEDKRAALRADARMALFAILTVRSVRAGLRRRTAKRLR